MTGVVKKPRSVTSFPMPSNVVNLVNTWGIRYQKEEKANKLEFLNCQKFWFDYDNDKLDETERLVETVNPELPAEFPGIPLELELEDALIEAILSHRTEQQA